METLNARWLLDELESIDAVTSTWSAGLMASFEAVELDVFELNSSDIKKKGHNGKVVRK